MRVTVIAGRPRDIIAVGCDALPPDYKDHNFVGCSAGGLLATVIAKAKRPAAAWHAVRQELKMCTFSYARALRGAYPVESRKAIDCCLRQSTCTEATMSQIPNLTIVVHDLSECRAKLISSRTCPHMLVHDALSAAMAWPIVMEVKNNICDALYVHSFRDIACLWGNPVYFAVIACGEKIHLMPPLSLMIDAPPSRRLPYWLTPLIATGNSRRGHGTLFMKYTAGLCVLGLIRLKIGFARTPRTVTQFKVIPPVASASAGVRH